MERFNKLLDFIHENESEVYTLIDFTGAELKVKYDTDYESSNGLEETDPKFEEFQAIIFEDLESGNLFEVNYHCLPEKVFCNNKNVI